MLINGFPAFAPELLGNGEFFRPEYFGELAHQEQRSFWFWHRNRLILWALRKYRPNFDNFLELGCGTGYVLSGIAKECRANRFVGSDIFAAGLSFAAQRLPACDFLQMDGRKIPYADEFDVIGAFDVLEHISEDESVLTQIHAALRPQGTLLVTVPQHAWLWSSVDDFACHVRRYSAKDLHCKLERTGFRVELSTSFITALLPAVMASRLLKRGTAVDGSGAPPELDLAPWLNTLFGHVSSPELTLIRFGLRFPVGASRLVVAKKVR